MLRVFCILLILSVSQSLAVLSNTRQDLALKPIVYKQHTTQFVSAIIPDISITNTDIQNLQTLQPQHQTTFVQNSSPYNYNPPAQQYLSSSSKEEVTSTPRSYISPSNQNIIDQYQSNTIPSNFNGASYQYYPNSPKEVVTTTSRSATPVAHQYNLNQYQTPSNYNRPSNQLLTLSQEQALTTPRSNIPTTTSTYYGPAYQYLPGTTQSLQTTTPFPNTSQIQNSGYFNNFPSNHKTHWSPVLDSRPQESTTNHVPSNIQPPIELHHGYRYIEPALKVNSSNFETINGVIYNELGLGQNETNTTQKPQPFVPQNPLPSKTEIETEEGYVYGNTQHNPHYPNTTVLIPVQTSMDTYKYYQPLQNHDSNTQNLNRQQLGQHEKQSQTNSTSQQQSTQYHNNKFGSQNLNHQQLEQQQKETKITTSSQEQSTQNSQHQNNRFISSNKQTTSQYPNHKYPNTIYNSQEILQTSEFTKLENNPSSNSRPPFSQPSGFFNNVNLISQSNNIASPQSNRYTTEITQQMATQIYPNIHTPSQTTSNKYYSFVTPQKSAVTSEIRPSNGNKQPQSTDSSNYIQKYPSNPFEPTGIQSNSQHYIQAANQERPPNYGTLNRAPQSLGSAQQFIENQQNTYTNPIPNLQTESNQYTLTTSHSNSQTIPQINPTTSDFTNRQPKPSASSNNIHTQSNRFDTSSTLTYPAFNQNIQNANTDNYYLTNSQSTSQTTPETQSQQFGATQQSFLPNYSSNQNPQNSDIHLSSSLPNDQTESYQGNRTPQSSSSNDRPNEQTQANRYDNTQHTSTSISFSNPNQHNRPITSHSSLTNLQTENNQHYFINTQHDNRSPQSPLEFNQFQNTYPQQQSQIVSPSHQRPQTSLTKPTQNPYNVQTESNQHYPTNPQSNSISLSSSSSNIRPNMQPELNKYYSSYTQPQNNFGNPTQKPSTNFALNHQTESNHYLYNKPQLTNKTPQITMSSNTPQQSDNQTDYSQSNNQPLTQFESNSQPLGNRIIFPHQPPSQPGSQTTFSATSLNSNNPLSSLSETPRYTPARQLFSQNIQQNQQSFLAKPSPTHQVPNTNTISDFFGQTSAASATSPLSAVSNVNIIPPTSDRLPTTNLMGNSNYLQMQSQSFEVPYYHNKPPQKPPVAATVDTVRLPHLTYGSPIRETYNSPPSVIIQPPYYKK